MLTSLRAIWERATPKRQRELIALMFDEIYVDLLEEGVVSVQPHPPFLPLFKLIKEHHGRKSEGKAFPTIIG